MSRWKVNIRLLPVKAHYFFFNAGASALIPFIPVLGKQLGIPSSYVGIIYGAAPFISFLAKPTIGIIADHFKKRKSIFLFCILLALMSSVCISFLGQGDIRRPVVFECSFGSSYIKQCSQGSRKCDAAGNFSTEEEVYSYYEKYPEAHRHEPLVIDKIDEEDHLNSSSSTTNPIESHEHDYGNFTKPEKYRSNYDTCHIVCYIHSIPQFLDFCNNLDQEYMPDDCIRKEMESEPMRLELSSTPDSTNSRREALSKKKKAGFRDIEPYILKFDANLKLSSSQIAGDCLYLRVGAVSFNPGEDELRQITCMSNQNILDACYADCPNNPDLNHKLERVMPDEEDSFSFTGLYGLLVITAFVSIATVNSISDALCFQLLGDRPDQYGMQRLWGAIGWGLFTLLAGFLIDTSSKGKLLKDYSPCFYVLAALLILDLIVAYKWEVQEMPRPKALRKDVCALLTDLRIIIFIMGSVIVGMCTGIHWNFLFWYVEDVAYENCDNTDHLKSLQGVMVALQCLSEMPFFYYAKTFIKRLGYFNCMSLVLFVFGVRFITYSCLSHIWLFVPVELLHGITYGVFYSVMATYASVVSPPGSAATVQGIFGAAFEGFGVAIGSFVGGILHQLWGGKTAFRVFGIGALIFCLIHHVLMLLFRQKRVYGVPVSTTEPEGREMCAMNGVSQEVDVDSE